MTEPSAARGLVVQVAGHLDEHRNYCLDDWRLCHNSDGTSTLTSVSADQAKLHGLLTGIRDLGVDLISVHTEPHPLPALPLSIQTRRLLLRPAVPADAEATWGYRRLSEVGAWLTEIPATLDAYRLRFTEPHRLAMTVIVEREHRVIGDCMLRIEDAWTQAEAPKQARGRQAELGWVIDPGFTGRGYATEAVRALIRECFVGLEIRRVTANCFLANTASWRLMERVGMRREQHAVRESLHRSGQWLDVVTYALLADETPPTADQ